MIIDKNDKSYTTCSKNPDGDMGETDVYVVDETTPAGAVLAAKVVALSPFFNFILDDNGNLVDIISIKVHLDLPATANVNDNITATASFLVTVNDCQSVDFILTWTDTNGVETNTITMPIVNGIAQAQFSFSSPGKYNILSYANGHSSDNKDIVIT